jgi:NAD(P)-dependent dehydrogenase (short-subunit alcohol dehydrogenase family)
MEALMGVNILVTGASVPAGRSMIDALHGDTVTLLACDCDAEAHKLADVPAEHHFNVHRSDDPEFVGDLVRLCLRYDVDVLVPMRVSDQLALARVRKLFEGLGASVWLAPIPAKATRSQARRVLHSIGRGRTKSAMGDWLRRISGFGGDDTHALPAPKVPSLPRTSRSTH